MKRRIAAKLVSIASKPGSKTEAAENKVKVNSYVHGLTAQHLIIEPIDQPDYDKTADNFRPADGFEQELLQKIIDTNWRLKIGASVESAMFSNSSTRHWDKPDDATRDTFLSRRARTFTEQANAFGILGRYEAGLQRRFRIMLRELETAIASRPEPISQAAASKQTEQNKPVTTQNDSFRRNLQRRSQPIAPNELPSTFTCRGHLSAGSKAA